MKIRTRFTIFISAISLVSAFSTYFFILGELREEQFLLIDRELHDVGTILLHKAHLIKSNREFSTDYPLDRYWIRLTDEKGQMLYQSRLASLVLLPKPPGLTRYFAKVNIPAAEIWIEPREEAERGKMGENIRFRVLRLETGNNESTFAVTIAKPIPLATMEMQEILYELTTGVFLFSALVIIASYLLAGKMLHPLHTINNLTREIRESSLYRRLPLTNSKDELDTLSRSLNEMFDRLQESFQKQKKLISDASHELKSPLTILRLGIEDLLNEHLSDETKKELEKQLVIIQRIQKLVTDLLDMSRLEQQDTLVRQATDVSQLLHDIISEFNILIASKRITVSLDLGNFTAQIDRAKMQRLFVNMVDNAITYNIPDHGQLAVSIAEQDNTLEISIANTGPVLPSEEYNKIFEQFYRVEKSRSQKYGGTGLGLTIARRIVEMHGGTITASGSGIWTTFLIRLPHSRN